MKNCEEILSARRTGTGIGTKYPTEPKEKRGSVVMLQESEKDEEKGLTTGARSDRIAGLSGRETSREADHKRAGRAPKSRRKPLKKGRRNFRKGVDKR
ncbi:MAG: hypothetical protein II889_07500, partial [Clostridia bacterium]|nr:hypothetical protein [Clostridia bacterium]